MERIPGKWTIHEHAAHLADVQPMLINRFEIFKNNPEPEFKPYLPGVTLDDKHLAKMDLEKVVDDFETLRKELLALLNTFSESDWAKPGKHPEYSTYNAHILVRHVLMHDHFHMYRIEELWITQDDFLRKS